MGILLVSTVYCVAVYIATHQNFAVSRTAQVTSLATRAMIMGSAAPGVSNTLAFLCFYTLRAGIPPVPTLGKGEIE